MNYGALTSIAGAALAFSPLTAHAATYYVAPNGNDANPGSEAEPFASFAQAQSAAEPGDRVYFAGGEYKYDKASNSCNGSQTAIVVVIPLNKSGETGRRIEYWAKEGEVPIFDFFDVSDDCRIKGIEITGSYVHLRGLEIRGVPQNNNQNHESWGVYVTGSNNILETLDLHHNMGPGVFLKGSASNNLVLNCDSHHNYDALTSNGPGESADGFGSHTDASGTGNIFRGCRAWWNPDDGYDLIHQHAPVIIENSWAWYNGYEPDTMIASKNGNGFKAGGYSLDTSRFPSGEVPVHIVRNSVAFNNRAAGFYANHHLGDVIFNNNTAINNGVGFNLLGIDRNGNDVNVGILRNNIAIGGRLLSNNEGVDDVNNSWNIDGISVNEADFQNLDVMGMDGPRQADGSLPIVPNFHLVANSDLIDKGVDVMLPFEGNAPDLGAFEYGADETGPGTRPGQGGAGQGGETSTGGTANGGMANGGTANGGGSAEPGAGGATNVGGAGMPSAGGAAPGAGGAAPGAGGSLVAGGGEAGGLVVGTNTSDAEEGCACSTAGSTAGGVQNLAWLALGLGGLLLRRKERF